MKSPLDKLGRGRSEIPAALLRALGAALGFFLVYEIFERAFLADAPMDVLRGLHRARGLIASALAALVAALSLGGGAPRAVPEAALPDAPARDDRAAWFVDLRWLAVLAAALAVYLSQHVLGYLPPETTVLLWGGVAVLAASNALYLKLLQSSLPVKSQLHWQIATDLLILSFLLRCSGGVASPAAGLMAFHVVLAGILFERREAFLVCGAASALFGGLALAAPSPETLAPMPFLLALLWGTATIVTTLAGRLRTSHQELLAAFFSGIPDGFAVVDAAGRVQYLNAAGARLLGPHAKGARGRQLCAVLCGEGGAAPVHGKEACPLLAARGARVAAASARALRLHAFGHERRLVFIENIAAEIELERRKEDWRHMLSHDLRTPLSLIIGGLAAVGERAPEATLGAPEWKILDIALRGARRMLDLLNLDLDVAKLEAGLMLLSRRNVPLAELARRRAEEETTLAESRRLSIDIDIPPTLAAAGDPVMISRVFQNLLNNAVKYSKEGGRISIRGAAGPPGRVRLIFHDEGPGIAPEDLPKIFDRYYQARARREGRIRGTGLGLTFCREALKTMGGTISATSVPGQGSEFTVDLPAAESQLPRRSLAPVPALGRLEPPGFP